MAAVIPFDAIDFGMPPLSRIEKILDDLHNLVVLSDCDVAKYRLTLGLAEWNQRTFAEEHEEQLDTIRVTA